MAAINRSLFKAYDIRGIVGETLTDEAAYLIGRAIATQAVDQGIKTVALGKDCRLSSPSLASAVLEGLTESGINVLNIGMVTSPMLYFAAIGECGGSGVMVTGSHNPPNENGFKIMLGSVTLAGSAIEVLFDTIGHNRFVNAPVVGNVTDKDIFQQYLHAVTGNIRLKRAMNIAVDAGNGAAGPYVERIYRKIGCEVHALFCEADGNFPNHHPNPVKVENLSCLISQVKNSDAEIGLAFDGDGDRLVVVTKAGEVVCSDHLLMLLVRDMLSHHPGAKVIFDVKSSRHLEMWIKKYGGIPVMERTGHSLIKSAMKKNGALIAGEGSGHFYFAEHWLGFDDGLYAGCRILEILSVADNVSDILDTLPRSVYITPETHIYLPEGCNGSHIMEDLLKYAKFDDARRIITIDGLRVEYDDGFGLIRASNTTPVLTLHFEADSEAADKRIQSHFKAIIEQHPALYWPL